MIVEATTPTRIDLAGGTLDLYPLYLFLEGGVTNNVAISWYSRVRIETRRDSEIHLRSTDLNTELVAPSVAELPLDKSLSLVARIVKFYAPVTGINVITNNTAPIGSGIGASSSLLIALSGALDRLNGSRMDPSLFVDYGANLEAQVIAIPTGKQDYLAALYGGVNAFHFTVKGWSREALVTDEEKLRIVEDRAVLSFTGEPHFSGTNNWNMMKNFMENAPGVRDSLGEIGQIAYQMRQAMLAFDLDWVGDLLDKEWQCRRQLAEGVTTPHIEQMAAAAREAGAIASKIMGAGGGGCMITVVKENRRQAVEAALRQAGATIMPFQIDRKGLTVTEL